MKSLAEFGAFDAEMSQFKATVNIDPVGGFKTVEEVKAIESNIVIDQHLKNQQLLQGTFGKDKLLEVEVFLVH